MAAVLKGVTVLFGVAAQAGISNFICQSVSVDKAFELNDKVADETGVTVTLRYDGVERTGTVEGIAKTVDMPEVGAAITIAMKTDVGVSQSISGVVESVSEKGSNKDFVRVSIKFRQVDGIASYV
jgi:enoyl-[acyl-carrier-protein] reductase (NADH)